MKRNDAARICRGCGAEICIIKTGLYGNVMVDAEPVWIRLQKDGLNYYTEDGRAVIGFPAGDADDDPDSNLIPAYEPHKGKCPRNGRKQRIRNRPPGYR